MIKATYIVIGLGVLAIALTAIGCAAPVGPAPKLGPVPPIERQVDPQMHVLCYTYGDMMSCVYHPALKIQQPKKEVSDEAK